MKTIKALPQILQDKLHHTAKCEAALEIVGVGTYKAYDAILNAEEHSLSEAGLDLTELYCDSYSTCPEQLAEVAETRYQAYMAFSDNVISQLN